MRILAAARVTAMEGAKQRQLGMAQDGEQCEREGAWEEGSNAAQAGRGGVGAASVACWCRRQRGKRAHSREGSERGEREAKLSAGQGADCFELRTVTVATESIAAPAAVQY